MPSLPYITEPAHYHASRPTQSYNVARHVINVVFFINIPLVIVLGVVEDARRHQRVGPDEQGVREDNREDAEGLVRQDEEHGVYQQLDSCIVHCAPLLLNRGGAAGCGAPGPWHLLQRARHWWHWTRRAMLHGGRLEKVDPRATPKPTHFLLSLYLMSRDSSDACLYIG